MDDSDGAGEADDTAGNGRVESAAFERRLDEAKRALEEAATEADLDDVGALVDDIETDLDSVTLDGEETTDDEDGDAGREALEDRIDDLRGGVEDQRGPYAEDITDVLDDAEETVTASEWTEQGIDEVASAVETVLGVADEHLGGAFAVEPSVSVSDASGPAAAADDIEETLAETTEAVTAADLDPDENSEAIAAVLGAAETLTSELDDAQVFDDLEVREQLAVRGFYQVLDPENRKDFPPEWNAVKLHEARGDVEPILTALDTLDSDFMQENALDALEHIGPEAAFDAVHELAQRRNEQPVRVLGRIGDDRACETLHDFLGGGDVSLEQTALWALGAIGSTDSTEPVAQRLVADNPEVRSAAARALGLIGDTRAIDPLAGRLAEDGAETVRASAAWALNQIGTERARDTLAEYDDDSSYLVQAEAAKPL